MNMVLTMATQTRDTFDTSRHSSYEAATVLFIPTCAIKADSSTSTWWEEAAVVLPRIKHEVWHMSSSSIGTTYWPLFSLSLYIPYLYKYTSITEYIITLILCNTIYLNMLQVKMLSKSKTQVVVQHLTTKEPERRMIRAYNISTRSIRENMWCFISRSSSTVFFKSTQIQLTLKRCQSNIS